MFAIVVAIVLFFAIAAGLYLLLKNMGENGIDIAAPGSCRRGSCGVARCQAADDAEEAEEATPQTADGSDQSKPTV